MQNSRNLNAIKHDILLTLITGLLDLLIQGDPLQFQYAEGDVYEANTHHF